jgi:putative glycerol-1-phosphate prenyltransferase
MNLYREILSVRDRKLFAVLIDPDKHSPASLERAVTEASESGADLFFVGGSLLTGDHLKSTIAGIRAKSGIPIVLFPGSLLQIDGDADAILLLSMISGRNPELLIGQHVLAAPYLKASGLEVIPTGYLLIDGGTVTTAQYVSNTMPIPGGKGDIAACTAMAGEMLGLRLIYLDAGSGAARPVAPAMIRQVKESISVPLIVGGGIREPEQARHACQAGADVVVVGNALENDPSGYLEMARAIHQSE